MQRLYKLMEEWSQIMEQGQKAQNSYLPALLLMPRISQVQLPQ